MKYDEFLSYKLYFKVDVKFKNKRNNLFEQFVRIDVELVF